MGMRRAAANNIAVNKPSPAHTVETISSRNPDAAAGLCLPQDTDANRKQRHSWGLFRCVLVTSRGHFLMPEW